MPGSVLTEGSRSTTGYTISGLTIIDALESDPAIAAVIDSFNVGATAPTVPVLLITNINDDIVPAPMGEVLGSDWRTRGAEVTELDVNTPQVPSLLSALGIGHLIAGEFLYATPAISWIADRFAQ